MISKRQLRPIGYSCCFFKISLGLKEIAKGDTQAAENFSAEKLKQM